MKIIYCLCFALLSLPVSGQIINHTPGPATVIIDNDTTIGIGAGGGFKSFLVCGGAVLSYAESSSMDTIMLEPGAKIAFDSSFSYGYAQLYAKSGSTVDMNFRQTGKLIHESGVNIVDTLAPGPSSFFMGAQQVSTINFLYTSLPGGIGCGAPSGLQNQLSGSAALLHVFSNENELKLQTGLQAGAMQIRVLNMMGQTVVAKTMCGQSETIDITALPKGVYGLIWKVREATGKVLFLK